MKTKLLFSVLFIVIIVCLFTVNTFADEPPILTEEQLKQAFISYYEINANEPIYYVINHNTFGVTHNYLMQFRGAQVGDIITYDEPLTFNDLNTVNSITVIYSNNTNTYYMYPYTRFETSYTTSQNNRLLSIKCYGDINDGQGTIFTLRIKYDITTKEVIESVVQFPTESSSFVNSSNYNFAVGSTLEQYMVLQYAYSMNLFRVSMNCNYALFTDAYEFAYYNGYGVGYDNGYTEGDSYGYQQGYEDGQIDGLQRGYENGYQEGLTLGGQQGYDRGYTEGYDDGHQEGYSQGVIDGSNSGTAYNQGYDDGYHQAVSEIDDGTFGQNILGSAFDVPFKALNNFKIIDYQLESGRHITVTIGALLSAIIGVSLFIWFMKLFVGG